MTSDVSEGPYEIKQLSRGIWSVTQIRSTSLSNVVTKHFKTMNIGQLVKENAEDEKQTMVINK